MTCAAIALKFNDVTLTVLAGGRHHTVLDSASLSIPKGIHALIGESRLVTVSVIDAISRRLVPQRGQIEFLGRVSWPLGHPAPFSVAVTGKQVVSHFAELYQFDRMLAMEFLQKEFAAPQLLHQPMEKWPRLLHNQFMLLMGLIPTFDIYLIDGNVIFPEDIAFSRRFFQLLNMRVAGRTVLITARQKRLVKALTTDAVIVADQKLSFSSDLDAALEVSNRIALGGDLVVERVEEDDNQDFIF